MAHRVLACSPDGTLLVSEHGVWRLADGKASEVSDDPEQPDDYTSVLALAADGRLLAALDGDRITPWGTRP